MATFLCQEPSCHTNSPPTELVSARRAINRAQIVYPYFVCNGRHSHKNGCTQPAALIEVVEDKVVELYRGKAIPPAILDVLESNLLADLEVMGEEIRLRRRQLSKKRERLEARRQQLLEAHYADAIPLELMKSEQTSISSALAKLNDRLAATDVQFEKTQSTLSAAMTLARDCYEAYKTATDFPRRLLNQVFFERITVEVVDDDVTVGAKLAEPFRSLARLSADLVPDRGDETRKPNRKPLSAMEADKGSSKRSLVDLRGLEPLTPCMPCRCATSCATDPRPRTRQLP